jgi:hypothetical protein
MREHPGYRGMCQISPENLRRKSVGQLQLAPPKATGIFASLLEISTELRPIAFLCGGFTHHQSWVDRCFLFQTNSWLENDYLLWYIRVKPCRTKQHKLTRMETHREGSSGAQFIRLTCRSTQRSSNETGRRTSWLQLLFQCKKINSTTSSCAERNRLQIPFPRLGTSFLRATEQSELDLQAYWLGQGTVARWAT